MRRSIALLLFLALIASATALRVELRDRVFVTETQVKLGDIAERVDGDKDLFEQISDTVVITLPWERQYRNIYAIETEDIIHDKTGETIEVDGGVCVVRWEQTLIDPDFIAFQAEGYVRQILELEDKARVIIDRVPDVHAPKVGHQMRFELASQSPDRLVLRGAVYASGKEIHAFLLHARVEITRKVLALKSAKRRGEAITEDDVTVVKQAVGHLSTTLTEETDLHGLQAARYLPSGAILDDENTRTKPAIERGDHILVTVRGAGVELNIEAIAKRNGKKGETILCENRDTGKRFEAIVTGPGRAEVNLEDPCAMQ